MRTHIYEHRCLVLQFHKFSFYDSILTNLPIYLPICLIKWPHYLFGMT